MNLEKQKIVQLLSIFVIIISVILLAFFWEDKERKNDRKNPLQINNYQEIDDRFLDLLEQEYSINREEIKIIMESWSWKTLEDVLKEKEIEFKFWKRD